MRRGILLTLACAVVLGSAMVVHSLRADEPDPRPPAYNPYPPGILPADLDSEIRRVRGEVRFVFQRYLTQWKALPPPTTTGNPPTLGGTGFDAIRILGGLLNYDGKMSPFKNEACAFCHMPYGGFSGPIPSINLTIIAYPGTFHFRAGKRTAQRYTYSPRFPVLHLNRAKRAGVGGTFTGGNFWDARSTGYKLQSPDAEQAQHPPVDTQEMGFPDTACIAFRLQTAVYRPLFKEVWGAGSLDIRFPHDTEEICETPGGAATFGGSVTPIRLSPEDRTKADSVYDNWGQSISFFESSNDVSPFTSKVDASVSTAPAYTFTATEAAGRTPVRRQGQLQFLPKQSLRRGAKRLRGVKMQLKRLVALVLSMLMMLAVVGCYGQPLSTREKGTLLGGVAGAGAGALIGSAVGHPGAGAAIGGVGGAAAGYGIGNHMQNEQNERAYRNGYY